MYYIGIDPGITGAVAWIDDREPDNVCYEKTPFIQLKRKEYDERNMAEIIRSFTDNNTKCFVTMEKVHSLPKDGTVGAFSFGKGWGIWLGVLAALKVSYTLCTPQEWKKTMLAGMPKEKGASVIKVKQLYPNLTFLKKTDHGIADAILIAKYGMEKALGK